MKGSKNKKRAGGVVELNSVWSSMRLPASVKMHLENHAIWARWHEIVGAELFRVTSPLEIKHQHLVVLVAHQAWAQQLHFLKPSLLSKIKAYCPDASIVDLHFRVGRIEGVKHLPKTEKLSRAASVANVPLSERQEMTLRAVEDKELRDSIRSAMEAYAQAGSSERAN